MQPTKLGGEPYALLIVKKFEFRVSEVAVADEKSSSSHGFAATY